MFLITDKNKIHTISYHFSCLIYFFFFPFSFDIFHLISINRYLYLAIKGRSSFISRTQLVFFSSNVLGWKYVRPWITLIIGVDPPPPDSVFNPNSVDRRKKINKQHQYLHKIESARCKWAIHPNMRLKLVND